MSTLCCGNFLFVPDLDRLQSKCSELCMDLMRVGCSSIQHYEYKPTIGEQYEYRPDKLIGYQKDVFKRVLEELNTCGFYYKGMTPDEAKELLKDLKPGRFLIRDSQSKSDYFTLTYKDLKSQTRHVRIDYCKGKFTLHSTSTSTLHEADTVLKLIQMYLRKRSTKKISSESRKPYLLEPIRKSIPSLQHLCRISLNKQQKFEPDKNTMPFVEDYMKVYAYKL